MSTCDLSGDFLLCAGTFTSVLNVMNSAMTAFNCHGSTTKATCPHSSEMFFCHLRDFAAHYCCLCGRTCVAKAVQCTMGDGHCGYTAVLCWKWPLPWQPKAFVAFRTSSHYYLFGFSQSKGVETCLGNWERKMELRQTLEIPAYCMDKQYSPVLHWAGFYFLSYSTAIELWFCLKKMESERRGEGGFF